MSTPSLHIYGLLEYLDLPRDSRSADRTLRVKLHHALSTEIGVTTRDQSYVGLLCVTNLADTARVVTGGLIIGHLI